MTAVALAPARTRLVAGLTSKDDIALAWDACAQEAPHGERPYLGPAWGEALAMAFAGEGRAHFVAFDDGRDVAGLAPLWLRRRFGMGLLTFLGSGPRDYSLADYQRLLVAQGREPEAAQALADWLPVASCPGTSPAFTRSRPRARNRRR